MRGIFFILLLLILSPSWAGAQRLEKKEGVAFVNIAPGELENDEIKKLPVKISFISESGIPYAGVYVRVFNASGIAVFKHLCEKPWLFLRLPAGEYHVVGVDRGKVTRLKYFKVRGGEGAPQTRVTLKWPQSIVGY